MSEELFNGKARALCESCYITDGNFKPLVKTRKGWQRWGDLQARKMRPTGFWNAVVCYVPDRSAYRINFGGQPETKSK